MSRPGALGFADRLRYTGAKPNGPDAVSGVRPDSTSEAPT
jgi:hypothetical protein